MFNRFLKYFFLLILVFGFFSPEIAQAQEVMIVQSSSAKPYQQAVTAFQQALSSNVKYRGIKSIHPVQTEIYTLNDNSNRKNTSKKYHSLQPDLILAVGSKALKNVSNLPGPIIYLMVSRPERFVAGKQNITGIRMTVDPAKQLAAITANFPNVTNLGVLYSPASKAIIKKATLAAKQTSITLSARKTSSIREIKPQLNELLSSIDALWLLPDPGVLTPATLDLFTISSINNQIPIIAFAPKYLKHGAALAIYAEPQAMGEQAAQMAERIILSGESIAKNPPEDCKQPSSKINRRILKKLGITYTESIPRRNERTP